MVRWSLRAKLLAATAVALLPVLALATWGTYADIRAARANRTDAVAAAAELAVSRHRELIEGSHRLLLAACANEVVRKSAETTATATDIDECDAYLTGLVKRFPAEYSAAVVTDAGGLARCSSVRSVVRHQFRRPRRLQVGARHDGFLHRCIHRKPSDAADRHPDRRPDRRGRSLPGDVRSRRLAQSVFGAGQVGQHGQRDRRHPGRSSRNDDRRQRGAGVLAAGSEALRGRCRSRRGRRSPTTAKMARCVSSTCSRCERRHLCRNRAGPDPDLRQSAGRLGLAGADRRRPVARAARACGSASIAGAFARSSTSGTSPRGRRGRGRPVRAAAALDARDNGGHRCRQADGDGHCQS